MSIHEGEERIYEIGLFLSGDVPIVEAEEPFRTATLILSQKEVSVYIFPPDLAPEEGINAFTLTCSDECAERLKYAIREETVRKN